MKRIVILIDGTWDQEGTGADTNVAKLDNGEKIVAGAFILSKASDGIAQNVYYHDGVGAEGDFFKRVIGGAIGIGLKKIIQDCYEFVVTDYEVGDEIYLFGFSRGAYAARALAGLIGASGISRRKDAKSFEVAWANYRVNPAERKKEKPASSTDQRSVTDYRELAAKQVFHDTRSIKCVAVCDTVGSYGIPAGFGLAPLARYFALMTLGFHDTSFGDHVGVGLHAVAVDEHRRPFVPTFWTITKGQQQKGHVEQTWFAGAHCNVGGGYADSGLSDQALLWMIARVQALTGLEFDVEAIRADSKPNLGGAVVDSTAGWPLDHFFPHYRTVLSPVAIHHGYLSNSEDRSEEHINERVHWSVIEKRNRQAGSSYEPRNLPGYIAAERIAAITEEERVLLGRRE